ncbi:hypothetical protein ACOCEA_15520 [Maribacter sp. CXY002]|uniref:hypothetical protein n=1 Tax=Maribacter luteocoastalis TaxID=3407671 RepID=UPI003B683C25
MKALFTLVLVLFVGVAAIAQNKNNNDKVDTFKMDVVLVTGSTTVIGQEKTLFFLENSVTRLYRYKNSRVKSELGFRTLKNRPKLA